MYENLAMPVFYRDVMYREGMEGKEEEAYLKLYDGHDWKWFCVRLKHTDLEYLRKNWSGKKKQKLHLWRKRDIQKRCEHQAHRKGMRISRICARNTSTLAYDGSGVVARDQKNHSLCTFKTGKRYHCDLSASYNIGARYFIRELFKPLPATERSLLEAKVPSVKRRTSYVYADLRELSSKMSSFKVS